MSSQPGGAPVDLASEAGVALLASGRGVEVRREPGAAWQAVPLPAGPAARVALARDAGGALVGFAWTGGQLWRFGVDPEGSPQRMDPPRLLGPLEIPNFALAADGALVVVLSDGLARREGQAWRRIRTPLPPGAALVDYTEALGRHWLASDAGLLVADAVEGPYARVLDGPGARPVVDLAGGPDLLLVAGERETHRAVQAAPRRVTAMPDLHPDVRAVQRAVLRHQALEAGDFAALRQGLRRRGWLPIVTLSGGYEQSRRSGRDYDESFVSGAMRRLRDRDAQRHRDWEAGAALTWDLGDVAYHPESIDVSREARARVALRDDVLDEVHQLYFERLRALAQLPRLAPEAPERIDLELRVAELTAALDGWTGGWFRRVLAEPPTREGPAPRFKENQP